MPNGGPEIETALARLRAGVTPAVVCGELAVRTQRWWDAALAVGSALGIPEPELRRRVGGEPDRVQGQFLPGEEDLYGELLATIGLFDVPRLLDERESAIAESLRAALGAMGGVASGHGLGLSRRFVTGDLAAAFLSLARRGPRATGSRPAEFWHALVTAGELLDPAAGDERGTVAQALDECRLRRARCSPAEIGARDVPDVQ